MCRAGSSLARMSCPSGMSWSSTLVSCQPSANVDCRKEIKCPKGWTLSGGSCYLLSRDKVSTLTEAAATCERHGSKLVEINTEEENLAVVEMAEAAMTSNGDQLDYWVGAMETESGWMWMSGAPMAYSNWWGGSPDGEHMGGLKGSCIQLLKKGKTVPGTLDTFYWVRANTNQECTNGDGDNGLICEMEGGH